MCKGFLCEECPQVQTCMSREASIFQIRSMFDDLHDNRRSVIIQDIRQKFKNLPTRKACGVETWIYTDDLGSGFDTRYIHISWMDTV